MSLEDFFLIPKRNGSKSFILIVWYLFLLMLTYLAFIIYKFTSKNCKIPFYSIRSELVINLIALRLCLRLCLLIYQK